MVTDHDINNLVPKKELNSDFWINKRLDPKIRQQLLLIAYDFAKELGLDITDIEDIKFTGSLANYNWSKFSDVDLHLVVDFENINKDIDLIGDYFKAKKTIWNDEHDIKMHDHDVEVYVENLDEPHFSSGVYSILSDEWLVEPKQDFKDFDKNAVKQKAKALMTIIDGVKRMYNEEPDMRKVIKVAEKVKEKIRNMRKCGLEKDGEFSVENLAFKILRRTGYLDELHSITLDSYDRLMTI